MSASKDILLSNGERLEVKVNFLTLKIINDFGFTESIEEEDEFKVACKMIYAILRSNGKQVTEDEALMLMPLDEDVIFVMLDEFKNKLEAFKKKQESRAALQNLTK